MKKHIGLFALIALWLGLSLLAWFSPAKESSVSERRPLAQFPQLSAESVLSGEFTEEFADYTTDQFPLRDGFRRVKALLTYYVFGQSDNNGIYIADGSAAKLEYPLDTASVDNALDRFQELYDAYLKDSASIHFAIVPDKGYYLAEASGHPGMDYDGLFRTMEDRLPWARFVDITDCLTADSYYRTDTHWRQEQLGCAAGRLAQALGIDAPDLDAFTLEQVAQPFYGVYCGQAALPLQPDTLQYLTWPGWEECTVYSYDTGKTTAVYDMDKLTSKDLYDIFLSGGMALQVIENPNAPADRELIVFRDSFGSSLIPLLVPEYSRITVIDTRYIAPSMLRDYVNFEGKNVLMLYSTILLNSSGTLRK